MRDAQLPCIGRKVPLAGAGKNATAGREHGIRCVGESLDREFAAYAVRPTNPANQ